MKKIFFLFLLFNTSAFSQTTWFTQNSGVTSNLNSTFFLNNLTGYCVGDSIILRTTNGGNNWTSKIISYSSLGLITKLYSVKFINDYTGFIVGGTNSGGGSLCLKTTNAGLNWVDNMGAFISAMRDVYFTSDNTGYAVGGSFPTALLISKSINNGNVWSNQLSVFGNNYLNSVYFTSLNTGYTVGLNGIIYTTTNGGVNWNSQISNVSDILHCIRFLNDSLGYIASYGGKILKTTNKGQNWFSIPILGTLDEYYSLCFTSLNTGFVVGQGSTIVKTTDGGLNWESLLSPSNQTLCSVFFSDGNTGYAVGEGGTIIKTTNGGGGIIEPSIKLTLKILMEGMYLPFQNLLSRKDTITVFLRDAAVPYILRDSAKGVIDSISHSNQFTFTNSLSSTYYIVAKHFNSLETWSKTGGILLINNGTNYNYEFTTSVSQAYGNNLKLVGLKYTTYSGDVNQDGFINLTDLLEVYNNSASFLSGSYIPSDLNSDGNVDLTDVTMCYNNSINFIRIRRP